MNRPLILWIMAGVLIWGFVHAFGAYLINPQRSIVIIVCTLLFLGFWVVMLNVRSRTMRVKDLKKSESAQKD